MAQEESRKALRRHWVSKEKDQLAYTLDKPLVTLFRFSGTMLPKVLLRCVTPDLNLR